MKLYAMVGHIVVVDANGMVVELVERCGELE